MTPIRLSQVCCTHSDDSWQHNSCQALSCVVVGNVVIDPCFIPSYLQFYHGNMADIMGARGGGGRGL
jgi:hypothetical protein